MTKIVYEWKKMPFMVSKDDTIGTKANKKLHNVAQAVVFEGVTELLARSHGYTVKQLQKGSGSKDHYAIYIEGTKEECEKHLIEIKEGKRNSKAFDDISFKVRNNFMFKRIKRKPIVTQDSIRKSKFDKMCDDLLRFGIHLEVYMDES